MGADGTEQKGEGLGARAPGFSPRLWEGSEASVCGCNRGGCESTFPTRINKTFSPDAVPDASFLDTPITAVILIHPAWALAPVLRSGRWERCTLERRGLVDWI